MRNFIICCLLILVLSTKLLAAVGCDLNDPDRDVRRFFPQQTSYKTSYFSLTDKGGMALQKKIEERLGDNFKGLFETVEVPYSLYTVYQGQKLIGYIHGVNQKGEFGGLQVFLALGPEGTIENFYIQKLTSQKASQFRTAAFARQFVGLNLKDFYGYDVATHKIKNGSGVAGITNPAADSKIDFYAILRGVKKNLILMDEFVFTNTHLKYFK